MQLYVAVIVKFFLLREAIPEKNLLLFGHCQNRLDPPHPCVLGHQQGTFFLAGKSAEIFFLQNV